MIAQYDTVPGWEGGLARRITLEGYDPVDGVVAFYNGPFSNFAQVPGLMISLPGWLGKSSRDSIPSNRTWVAYPTVEHWYQSCKTTDTGSHDRIRAARTPATAKALGREVELRPDWEEVKWAVMLHGLRAKFLHHAVYEKALRATRGAYILEDSPADYVWGARDARGGWGGLNLLGKALMRVRSELP